MARVREGDDVVGIGYPAIVHMHGKGSGFWDQMYTGRCMRIHTQRCVVTSLEVASRKTRSRTNRISRRQIVIWHIPIHKLTTRLRYDSCTQH